MEAYLSPIIVLGVTGIVAAIILWVVAKRFAVKEDERIALVEALLPGANCGACGFKGCHDFATACCGATTLTGMFCPGTGNAGMAEIAKVLGLEGSTKARRVAIVKCQGSCDNRIGQLSFTTVKSCLSRRSMAFSETTCVWGCLGCGDCVAACNFDAIKITGNGLPAVDPDKCTGCGNCATACPQSVIETREVKPRAPIVYVGCVNHDKGATARKECASACIGCGKCARTCPQKAITVADNVAHVDESLCTGCGMCVEGCPTKAIVSIGGKIKINDEKADI